MVSNYCPGSCWSTWPPGGHNTRRPQRAQLVPYLVSINRADVDGWCGWEWDHWFEWHSAGTPLASVHWLSTPKMALVTFSSCCSGCSRCSCSCSCCCCFLNMLLFIYLFFLCFPSPPLRPGTVSKIPSKGIRALETTFTAAGNAPIKPHVSNSKALDGLTGLTGTFSTKFLFQNTDKCNLSAPISR